MRRILNAALVGLLPGMAAAETPPPLSVTPLQAETLDALRWRARPVVVLGADAMAVQQIALLQSEATALIERDVVVLTDGPGARGLRDADGFAVLLIAKDGGVKLRRDAPVAAAELIALIDAMPMRRREAE